jgi:two-component system CheB/CheR fusion protein
MRIYPYRTLDNFIQGAVVTFIDITSLKKAEEEIRSAQEFTQQLMNIMKEAVLVLDNSLRIVSVNQPFLRLFRVGEEQVTGRYMYELGTGQWNIAPLRKLLERVLPGKTDFDNYLVEHDFPEIGHKKLNFRGSRFLQPKTQTEMILLAIEEV